MYWKLDWTVKYGTGGNPARNKKMVRAVVVPTEHVSKAVKHYRHCVFIEVATDATQSGETWQNIMLFNSVVRIYVFNIEFKTHNSAKPSLWIFGRKFIRKRNLLLINPWLLQRIVPTVLNIRNTRSALSSRRFQSFTLLLLLLFFSFNFHLDDGTCHFCK